MADPWAEFTPVFAAAPPAPAAAPGGADPWAEFHPAEPDRPKAPWTLQSAVLPALNGIVRSAANAVPVVGAYADKLDAATDSALTGKSADKALADQKAADRKFASDHPVLDGAAGFAGAAGGSVAMLPEWGLGAVGGLGQRVVGSTVGGTTLGTADALARGENPAIGAGVGFAGGAAGPLIAKGAGAAYRGAAGLASGAPDGVPGLGRVASKIVAKDFAGETPESLAEAARRVGPSGMLGEMNPAALDTLGGIADTPGAGKATVRDAYKARNDGAMGRAGAIMDQGFGPQVDMATLQRDTAAARSAAADPLYAQWRDTSVPMTPDLQEVLGRPSVQSAIPQAARKAGDQGRSIYATPAQRGSWELDPVGSGRTPEMPPDLPEPPPYSDTPAPSRPGPVGAPRPQDLFGFVRSLGGIQDPHGDLAAMGLQSIIARPGKGLGPDAVRQVAAEAGYLGADTNAAMRNSTIGDLYGALENGDRTFSAYDEDALHAWAARDAAMADYQQRGGAGADPTARAAGPRPTAPGQAFGGGADLSGRAAAPQLTAEGLDYIKRALDDKITSAIQGGNRDDARIYTSLKQQLVGAVDNHPDPSVAGVWKQARQAWSDPTSLMTARENGQAVFGKAQRADELAHEFGALSDPEKAAFLQGARDNVGEVLGATLRGDTTARNLLLSPNGQAKLRALLGPDEAEAITASLGHEAFYREAANNIAGGSQTTPKAQRTAKVSPEGINSLGAGVADFADGFSTSRPGTWLPPGLRPRSVYDRLMGGRAEQARSEVADLYTKAGPQRDALLDALVKQQKAKAAIAPPPITDPLVRALVMGAGQYLRQ